MVLHVAFMETNGGGLYNDYSALCPRTYDRRYWNIPFQYTITANDVENGQDIQGISWQNMEITRRRLRQKRIRYVSVRKPKKSEDESESSGSSGSNESIDEIVYDVTTPLIFESDSEETESSGGSADGIINEEYDLFESDSDGSGDSADGIINEDHGDGSGGNADGIENEEHDDFFESDSDGSGDSAHGIINEDHGDGSGGNADGIENKEHDDFFESDSDGSGSSADGIKNEEHDDFFEPVSDGTVNEEDEETEIKGNPKTLEDEDEESEEENANLYEFFLNTREVRPRKGHHQLSDLVWAKSRNEVYVMNERSAVSLWSLTTRELTEVYQGFAISTFAVNQNLFIGGGMHGQLVYMSLDGSVISDKQMTEEIDSITTSIEIHDSGCFTVTNNDGVVRVYDTETFELQTKIKCQFRVNKASLSPDGSFMVVGGESRHVRFANMLERQEGTAFYHTGDCHGLAWHPDGMVFASSCNDNLVRVWDIRQNGSPLHKLPTSWSYVTSLCFSSEGDVLVTGESDFVTLYSSRDKYRKRQRIDFFGPLAGVSLSPDDESLFIGIQDESLILSSLMIYHRVKGGGDREEEDGGHGEGLGSARPC